MPPTKATSTAAPSRTFEVHRKAGDRWVVDSIADDKQIAIRMANALLKAGRARGGVKVIAVTESADGEFRESQIYQATPESQAAAAPAQTSVAAAPAAKPKIRIERAKPEATSASSVRAGVNKKRAGSSIGWPVWAGIAAVGLLLAWGTIFGLPGGKPWVFDSKEAQTTVKTPNSFQQQYRTIFDR